MLDTSIEQIQLSKKLAACQLEQQKNALKIFKDSKHADVVEAARKLEYEIYQLSKINESYNDASINLLKVVASHDSD